MTTHRDSSAIDLREANPFEAQWLALGPQEANLAKLFKIVLGFRVSAGRHWQHPLITDANISTALTDVQAVLEFMAKHGIPNEDKINKVDKELITWYVRSCHMDQAAFKAASNSKLEHERQLATRIATDDWVKGILTQQQVLFINDCCLLAGADGLPNLLEGVHYAKNLEQLRVMIRNTGCWNVPGRGDRCARLDRMQRLALQAWAATCPAPLNSFHSAAVRLDQHPSLSTACPEALYLQTIESTLNASVASMPKETTSMDGTGLLAHEGASAKRHKRNEKPAALDEQHLKVKLDDGHHEEAAFEEQDCNIDHDNDFEQLHMEQSASNSGGAVNSTEWEIGQKCASDENEYPELEKLHTYQDEDIFIVKLLGNEFWCNDASIIKHTLGVLLALQQRSIQSALTFAHWNGYALLRGLMKKWDKFEFVQLAALTLLGHTAGNDDQIAERLLAEQGLFESVFSALQQHDNKYMAEAVFCAAAAMAIGNGNVKHIVEEHEGIEKAVATMEEYPNCEPVQSACITFLHAISEDGQFHQRFRKCKGGNMLLRAIDRFSGNDALRNEALAVIAPLLL